MSERIELTESAEDYLLRRTYEVCDSAHNVRWGLSDVQAVKDVLGRSLFQSGEFNLHSGGTSDFKIDCGRLNADDLTTLARQLVRRIGLFGTVEGVPRGGVALADAMRHYISEGPLLIVDDVLTTGASMERYRTGRDAIGAVLFARGPCPEWVTPLFVLTPERSG